MSKNLEEEARKKRTNPVYSSTYEKDLKIYIKTMQAFLINKNDKYLLDPPVWPDFSLSVSEKCCSNPQKYKNIFNTFKFWSCKNCGADLGDIND